MRNGVLLFLVVAAAALVAAIYFMQRAGKRAARTASASEPGMGRDIAPEEAMRRLQSGEKIVILDVRTPAEWKGGHIPNARHIFLGELREQLGNLDRIKPTAVYCDSGYRASIATSILEQEGFDSVCNVPGSWQAWEKAGFPVEKEIEKEKK